MNECDFCIDPITKSSNGVSTDRILREYAHWWLLLQRPEKLQSTKQAAGLLVAKEHQENVTDINQDAAVELLKITKEAARLLCEKVGTTYTNQETVGFNQGIEAGQTMSHAHVHILPVSAEDPSELKSRAGIGGAFEALRNERLGVS